jgi:hypothetical protein
VRFTLADIIGVAAMSRRERSAACAPPMTLVEAPPAAAPLS